jgi:hypothetical protein
VTLQIVWHSNSREQVLPKYAECDIFQIKSEASLIIVTHSLKLVLDTVYFLGLFRPLYFRNWFCFHLQVNRIWKKACSVGPLIISTLSAHGLRAALLRSPKEPAFFHILLTRRQKQNQFPQSSGSDKLWWWTKYKIVFISSVFHLALDVLLAAVYFRLWWENF